jgi:oligo-alginate lyase
MTYGARPLSTARRRVAPALLVLGLWLAVQPALAVKDRGTLYPPPILEIVRANVERSEWGRACRQASVKAAAPWLAMSDEQLWNLAFGPGITRSWMVWSNGHCPACEQSVPMYNWRIDALKHPWKVRCPHCEEFFPKNDFAAFRRSGLNDQGLFAAARADRSLLFNTEHPDPADPLHRFGVDDGDGYTEDENRWRFIGAYLIYGQWKQAVLQGMRELGAAYVLTGQPAYAHKAAVLLDRVADVWPGFDFKTQAVIYEKRLGSNGSISVWHDACMEVRQMAMAYDMVFDQIRHDAALVEFLSAKAAQIGLENPKKTFADIQRNIEDRIFRDTLSNKHKIHSNYPQQDITMAIILAVLGMDENRPAFNKIVDAMIAKATAVDGLTGEKGLVNYSAFAINGLARFLGEFAKIDAEFLPDMLRRFPNLRKTYRFHIDTHCLGRYYPLSGDTGKFAAATETYKGMNLSTVRSGIFSGNTIQPSAHTLLWRLYQLTDDVAYVQTMVSANGGRTEGLPYDLTIENSESIRTQIERIIEREGIRPALESVNFDQWHLAIMRSGQDANRRALWLDYDSGGPHGHQDGMNLGLFAHGLDLMPDFGYPPVQFGGWSAPRARWYRLSAAHNTVVVDGANSQSASGRTTLWADGELFHALRATCPAMNGKRRFERTAVLVDVTAEAFYLVDIFRVAGGSEHTKFMHSHFGTLEADQLQLEPGPDYGRQTQMRALRWDHSPPPVWHVDWSIEDRHELLPPGQKVRLRYTDLTGNAEAAVAEGWVVAGGYDSNDEAWIPRVLTRRRKSEVQEDKEELKSTFVALIDPYHREPTVTRAERLPVQDPDGHNLPESYVALSMVLPDGGRDILVLSDPEEEAPAEVVVGSPEQVRTDAEVALVRFAADGTLAYVAMAGGTRLQCGQAQITNSNREECYERFLSNDPQTDQ